MAIFGVGNTDDQSKFLQYIYINQHPHTLTQTFTQL